MRPRPVLPITLLVVSIVTLAGLIGPASASAAFLHTVLPGESLTSIAAADGLSVAQLAAANGLSPQAQLIIGSTVAIPPQGAPSTPAGPITSVPATSGTEETEGDGDSDGDDPVVAPSTTEAVSTSAVSTSPAPSGGSYVVQPGDTLTAIAARAGTSVASLAAANGLDPNGVLISGRALILPAAGSVPTPPSTAPAVGTTIVGRMTWFGGPNDPNAQGAPASGLGWRSDGMAFFNSGSLGHHWLIRFPWGQTLPMTQIDIGPAPWTGNPFDIAYSALPNTPYTSANWPNPTVTGIYQGP